MGGVGSSDWTARGTLNVGDGVFWQQDNSETIQRTLSGNTAFTGSTSSVSEPSILLTLGVGLIGSIRAIRRNLR